MIEKRKKGKRWLIEPAPGKSLTIEIIEVEGLGNFIEIESMVSDPAEVPEARAMIENFIGQLGIAGDSIEKRPYTLLLYELQHGKGPS